MSAINGRDWIAQRFGDDKAARIGEFLAMVVAENERQNLIAPSTIPAIWERHALDSAQLMAFDMPGLWIDIGTGGGFPGMVVAILRDDPVLLVEPRARRAGFLRDAANALSLGHVEVAASKVERVTDRRAAIVSARAVASIEALRMAAKGCTDRGTRWVLQRGRSAMDEVDALRRGWSGVFHVEQSLVDPESIIVMFGGRGAIA